MISGQGGTVKIIFIYTPFCRNSTTGQTRRQTVALDG